MNSLKSYNLLFLNRKVSWSFYLAWFYLLINFYFLISFILLAFTNFIDIIHSISLIKGISCYSSMLQCMTVIPKAVCNPNGYDCSLGQTYDACLQHFPAFSSSFFYDTPKFENGPQDKGDWYDFQQDKINQGYWDNFLSIVKDKPRLIADDLIIGVVPIEKYNCLYEVKVNPTIGHLWFKGINLNFSECRSLSGPKLSFEYDSLQPYILYHTILNKYEDEVVANSYLYFNYLDVNIYTFFHNSGHDAQTERGYEIIEEINYIRNSYTCEIGKINKDERCVLKIG